jgi:hypothetical protein
VVFTATSKIEILTDNIWICDSGACGHYCKSDNGLFDVKDINEKITVGNGESMKAIKVKSFKCHVIQLNGSTVNVKFKEVKYVPELWVNSFSISKALKKGFNLNNKGLMISSKKESISVTFDRVIKTVNGSISSIKMTTYDPYAAYITKGSLTSIKELDVNKFHEMVGHCGVDRLKKTTNIHGLKLKREFKVCEDCAVAKARKRNVNKEWKGGSQVLGERVYLDVSSIKSESYGCSHFWAIVVDDHTDYCWSLFLNAKSNVKGKFLTLLTYLKISGLDDKFIQCNDLGETKALIDECRSKGYNMKFEFSDPRAPQCNCKVERKFQTFFGRIRAMINSAGVKDQLQSGVWEECAMAVTFLLNVTSIKIKEVCTYELLFGCKPKLTTSLRSFVEISVVTITANIQSKLKNRGTPCISVGYSVHHANDV